jgi:hypothetical protein
LGVREAQLHRFSVPHHDACRVNSDYAADASDLHTEIRKERETMKFRFASGALAASLLLLAAVTGARADDWILLGQKIMRANDPSTTLTAEEGKWKKEDMKKVKLSVEGADVEITKVVYHWNLAKDDTVENVGVIKSGGSGAEHDAPRREATLESVAVQYKVLNGALQATLKVWGYD